MKILLGGKLITVTKEQITGKHPIPGVPRETDKGQHFPTKNIEPESVVEEELEGNEEDKSIFESYTVSKLKGLLDSNKIEFPKTAKKADLIELADSIESVENDDIESI